MPAKGYQFLPVHDRCARCGQALHAGTRVWRPSSSGPIICVTCSQGDVGDVLGERPAHPDLAGSLARLAARAGVASAKGAHAVLNAEVPVHTSSAVAKPIYVGRANRAEEAEVRLHGLLATLSEGEKPNEAWLCATDSRWVLQSLLEEVSEAGSVVLRNRRIPGRSLAVANLVIAPRGVVVVESARRRQIGEGNVRPRCSGPLRGAMRCSLAVKTLLSSTEDWSEVNVSAAVCLLESVDSVPLAPLVLGNSWIGWAYDLVEWLSTPGPLSVQDRMKLAAHLDEALAKG